MTTPLHPESGPLPPPPKKTSKWLLGILIAIGLLALLIFGSCVAGIAGLAGLAGSSPTLSTTPVEKNSGIDAETKGPAPTKASTLTRAQKEAIEAAESYLDSGHFSKKGLIEQLTSEYGEHFAKKDAVFAVEYIDADYKKEAVEAAESYLDSGHFSKSELIDQLESSYGEDFTHSQAVYAVNKVY